jgi:hypothetical protein
MVTWDLVPVVVVIIIVIIIIGVIISTSIVKVFYALMLSPWKVISFELRLRAQEFSEVLTD